MTTAARQDEGGRALAAIDKHAGVILAAICIGAAALAWVNRFIQDDAFISLRYARNLVDGHGLVWNAPPLGERVEGYTNFLWTLILSAPLKLGIDPFLFVSLLGAAMMPVTIVLTYRLALAMYGSKPVGLAACLLLATNYTFSCYATGGLETHLQALLCTAALMESARMFASHGGPTRLRLVTLSLVCGLAVLTRLDSVLIVGPAAALAAYALARDARRTRSLLWLVLPGAAVVGAWLAWKVAYYGELLPNTFYAKAASRSLPLRGVFYIASFLISYFLAPFAAAAVFFGRRMARQNGIPKTALALGVPALWCLYLVKVGGDFMEFRFMVPVMPLMMVLVAWVIVGVVNRVAWSAAMIAVLVGASAVHAAAFDRSPLKRGLESIADLKRNLHAPAYDWVGIGEYLHDAFEPSDAKPLIAVTPAGAIPYYSGLPSVDMLGLNDRWIARHGATLSDRPGHQKIATVAYMVERGVTFVIGHPVVASAGSTSPDLNIATYRDGVTVEELRKMFVGKPVPDPGSFPAGAKVALIPFAPGRHLVAVYLSPSPAWDADMARLGWETVELKTD